MKKSKVWLVTGASKGLGLTLVKELLKQGYCVAATSRTIQSLIEAVGNSESFYPISLDITNDNAVKEAIEKIVHKFGQINVIVNNAGYSQIGTIEELADNEVQQNFQVNVFGSINLVRHIAPYFRKQKSGHIFNISSIGGLAGNFPAFGVYCATKFAVAGFTEALVEEMKPFGVHTTLVYPGYFRTNFLADGSIQTPKNPIDAYNNGRKMETSHLQEINGKQPNDPQKAAELFIEVNKMEQPPIHLLMGEDACKVAENKILILTQEIQKWKNLSLSTSF